MGLNVLLWKSLRQKCNKKTQGFGRAVEHENDVTADYGLLSLPSAGLLLSHDAAEDKSWLTANERQNPKKCVACVKRRFMQNEHFNVKLAALHASELAFSTSESSSCPCNFLLPACVFHDIMRFLAWLRLILAHDVRAIVCCFWGLPEEIAKRPHPPPPHSPWRSIFAQDAPGRWECLCFGVGICEGAAVSLSHHII